MSDNSGSERTEESRNKLSHDLSPAKMASEEQRIVVLISGSGEPRKPADSLPSDPNRHQVQISRP